MISGIARQGLWGSTDGEQAGIRSDRHLDLLKSSIAPGFDRLRSHSYQSDFTDPNRQTLLAGAHEQKQTLYRSQDGKRRRQPPSGYGIFQSSAGH
jgi:hypothetical protein